MPPKSKNDSTPAPPRTLKPLRLQEVSGQSAAARRPLRPTHEAGTTHHARHHVPRSAQS